MGGKAAIFFKRRKKKYVFFLLPSSAKVWLQLSGPNTMENQGRSEESRSLCTRCWALWAGTHGCRLFPTAWTLREARWGAVLALCCCRWVVFKLWYVSYQSVVILLAWDCLSPPFHDHFPSKVLTRGFPGTLHTSSVTASATVAVCISCIYR